MPVKLIGGNLKLSIWQQQSQLIFIKKPPIFQYFSYRDLQNKRSIWEWKGVGYPDISSEEKVSKKGGTFPDICIWWADLQTDHGNYHQWLLRKKIWPFFGGRKGKKMEGRKTSSGIHSLGFSGVVPYSESRPWNNQEKTQWTLHKNISPSEYCIKRTPRSIQLLGPKFWFRFGHSIWCLPSWNWFPNFLLWVGLVLQAAWVAAICWFGRINRLCRAEKSPKKGNQLPPRSVC